ncbi:MAG: hypothetical protein WDN28_29840 [Chthoniobacter sp.]
MNATHVYNDGYNIHGKCRDCVFEHIGAFECGDDGISAHDDCQYRVDGLVSIGNSTGIADTVDSITEYDSRLYPRLPRCRPAVLRQQSAQYSQWRRPLARGHRPLHRRADARQRHLLAGARQCLHPP